MSKTSAVLTKAASPLEEARAELARRQQRRDADLAQYGSPDGYDDSQQARHLRRRDSVHQALITHAEEAVMGLEFDVAVVAALAAAKAAAQKAVEVAQEAAKARAVDVERETAAIEQAKARAAALQAQIAYLADSRHKGLDVAQAALAECTHANDQAGAAAAAEALARIETEAAAVDARIRPLQLQIDAVRELATAAEARLEQARGAVEEADNELFDAKLEVLAIARDEAVLALRRPQLDYEAANAGTRRRNKNLPPVDLEIGASHQLLGMLGKNVHEKLRVSGLCPGSGQVRRELIDESIFNQDPLQLEDAAAMRAGVRARARQTGPIEVGYDVDELAGRQIARA